ncbi:MAG: hypothetical protein K2X93_18475 [Candidatus Obscuribacterales bacterium]|nr:hypothetical protein [Candidatus Obscuribacterales bacterium]
MSGRPTKVVSYLILVLSMVLISSMMLARSAKTEIEASQAWIRHYSGTEDARSHEAALDSAREALTLAKQFNEFDPRYSESLRRIAELYIHNGQFEEAEPFLLQEMAVLRKFGPKFPDLDFDLFWLAVMNERRGDLAKAKRMFKEALVLARGLRKDGEPEVFHIYGHLAAICLYEKEFKRAAEYRQNAVDYIFATALNDEQICSGAMSLRMSLDGAQGQFFKINPELASAYIETIGECSKAAVAKQETEKGVNNLPFCDLLLEYAYMKAYYLEDDDSIPLYLRGLSLLESKFPDQKKRIGTYAAHLSSVLTALGRDSEAVKYLGVAFNNFEQVRDSPDANLEWLVHPTKNLTALLLRRGNVSERIKILERYLALGTEEPAKFKTRKSLAESFKQLGNREYAAKRFAGAAQYYERSVQHYRQCVPASLELCETLEQLGHTYMLLGQDRKAESYLDEVVYGLEADNQRSFGIATVKRRALFDLAAIGSRAGRPPSQEYAEAKNKGDELYLKTIADLERACSAREGNQLAVANATTKIWQTHFGQARTLAREGRFVEAAKAFELGHPVYVNVVGTTVDYFWLELEYVNWLLAANRYDEAEPVLYNLIIEGRASSGLEFFKCIGITVDHLRTIYRATSRPDREKAVSTENQIRVFQETALASRYLEDGCYSKASELFNKILEEDSVVFGAQSLIAKVDLDRSACYSFLTDNYEDAEKYCNRFLKTFYKPDARTCQIMNLLASVHNRAGRPERAEKLLRDKLSRSELRRESTTHRITALYALAVSLCLQDKVDAAAHQIESARKLTNSPLQVSADTLPSVLSILSKEKPDAGLRFLNEELKLYRKNRSEITSAVVLVTTELGNCHAAKKQFRLAVDKFEDALRLMMVTNIKSKFVVLQTLVPYEQSLRALGRVEEANRIVAKIRKIKSRCK